MDKIPFCEDRCSSRVNKGDELDIYEEVYISGLLVGLKRTEGCAWLVMTGSFCLKV
jgi:hypothetical protein